MLRLLAVAGCLAFLPLQVQAEGPLHLRFSSGPKEVKKARKGLARWLRARAKREFPAKMRILARELSISLAQQGGEELRDAVAAIPAPPAPETPCSSLELCPDWVGVAHADGVSSLGGAVAELVQPWLLLQHRRGAGLSLSSPAEVPGTLARMTLDGLATVPVDILASPSPTGGLLVWLRSSVDLGAIYAYSREEVLVRR